MAPRVLAKICGVTRTEDVTAAVAGGVAYLGFVFIARSSRHLSIDAAGDLAQTVPDGVRKVGLVLDADDAALDAITAGVRLDMLQLHGAETPARVAEVKARYGLPVMKAIGVAEAADLDAIDDFADIADQLLIDTKPPKGAALPGGNGLSFDWHLLAGRQWDVPWMLAGGLTAETVGDAVRQTGARQVDVSSAVERAPGQKDAGLIGDFLNAVHRIA